MKIWAEISAHRSFHAWILIPSAIKVVPIISVLSIAFEKVLDFAFFQKINSDCFYFFAIGFRTSLYYRVQTNHITCDEKYTRVF